MLTILKNGLETNPVFLDRAKYISDHVGLWRLAWFSWSIAAVAILYFFASFVWAHGASLADPADVLRFALLLATVAVAADLAAEAIEIGVLPGWLNALWPTVSPKVQTVFLRIIFTLCIGRV